jgi:hypothetical protein
MEDKIWYDEFMDIIHKKYPNKKELLEKLIPLLGLEKETIYRRLRGDIYFTANEVVTLSSALGISLDEITGINLDHISFQMRPINYLNPSKDEQGFLKYVIAGIRNLQSFPDSELMEICNKFPRSIIAGFENLNKFQLFKWRYQYSNENESIPLSKINTSEEEKQIVADYYQAIKCVSTSNIIWDKMIFEYLISDINYFSSVYLINEEEKEALKKEMYALLDYWLEVAAKGYYPETKNKVNLYISHLNIDTNYTYTFSPETCICFIIVFEKYEVFSFNSELISNFMAWMQWKKRSSTQISEVDEKSRIDFFLKQRQLIDKL